MNAPTNPLMEIPMNDQPASLDLDERRAKAREAASRNVPRNPNPLCRDFQQQPEPSAFWCANCHWNKPMHSDEIARGAIAEALDRLPAGGPATPAP